MERLYTKCGLASISFDRGAGKKQSRVLKLGKTSGSTALKTIPSRVKLVENPTRLAKTDESIHGYDLVYVILEMLSLI